MVIGQAEEEEKAGQGAACATAEDRVSHELEMGVWAKLP